MNKNNLNYNMSYNPNKKTSSFYQICQFKNEFTKQYPVRKVIVNELGDIIKCFEKEYSMKSIEAFCKSNRTNKYKLFPTNNLQYIGLPNPGDIFEVQSELLNNKATEYGFQEI